MKFISTVFLFIIGIILFFCFETNLELSYGLLVVWIFLCSLIFFFGSYLIQFNFYLRSINQLPTTDKKVYLTFDDGPNNPTTTTVLEVLKKHEVKALFCVIGKYCEGNDVILKKIVADGHTLANHSFSHHALFDVWSTKKVTADIASCQEIIKKYQPNSIYFRPPYGVTNPNIARAIKKLNLQSVGWNVRSFDTSIKDVEKIKTRILSQLKPGAIILLHDRLDFMPQLLDELIPKIKESGFEFTATLKG